MSSCLTGGGRAYRLDLDIIKSPSNSWISNSSSPSSTLSESSNFSTRKPRTPRKRPNQTYNEAATILSTAHPKIFPTKHLTKSCKFTKSHDYSTKNPLLFDPSSDLLMPYQVIDVSEFLLNQPILEREDYPVEQKSLSSIEKQCQSPGEISSQSNFMEIPDDEYREDFDAESILDEEIEEGIDSIMGNLSVENESTTDDSTSFGTNLQSINCCYGYPVGLGFEFGNGLRSEIRAIRNVDEGNWWRFPSVNVVDVTTTPKSAKMAAEKKKKKVEIKNSESNNSAMNNENLAGKSPDEEQPIAKLMLKLNYDDVLKGWSDKDSPFSGDAPGGESGEYDVQARLAQIDLFSEKGGVREASVLRYKEKRRTRLFSKKIRYQVRKVNADRRPRMKGRFVRTPDSPDNEQG